MPQSPDTTSPRPKVFIQTNDKQSIGAVVSAYSMKRSSKHADKFDVAVIRQEDYEFFRAREGQNYRRHGVTRTWHMMICNPLLWSVSCRPN